MSEHSRTRSWDAENRISEALRRWDDRLTSFEKAVVANTVSVAEIATEVGLLRRIIFGVFVFIALTVAGVVTKNALEAKPQEPLSAIVHTR